MQKATKLLGGATVGAVMVGGLMVPAPASAASAGTVYIAGLQGSYTAPSVGCKKYLIDFNADVAKGNPNSEYGDVWWSVDWTLVGPDNGYVDGGYTYGTGRGVEQETFSLCSYEVSGTYKIVGQTELNDTSMNPQRIELEDRTYASFYVHGEAPVTEPPAYTPPPKKPAAKKKRMRVKQLYATPGPRMRRMNRLFIDVNPNRKTYKVRIQKKKRGKWRTVRVVKTRGKYAIRTVKVKRGRYRVVVPRQYGMKKVRSKAVWVSGKRYYENFSGAY